MKYVFNILFLLLIGFATAQNADELVVIHNVDTTTEMNAIENPLTGSLVFNSEKNNLFFFDGTKWIFLDNVHTPYITNVIPETVNSKQTTLVTFRGIDFTQNTQLTIPNFTGTINSVTIVSPRRIDVNLSANDSPVGLYDIILTDNDRVNNTSWVGNGVGKLEIIEANGTDKIHANMTCKRILDDGFSTGDGMYWINPDEYSTNNAFEVYCDMTTNGGGWTRIDYVEDLELVHHFSGHGDAVEWLNTNLKLNLTDTQINNIRDLSNEGKQTYVGECNGVMHYYYENGDDYNNAIGFRFHTGFETSQGQQNYDVNVNVIQDGCEANDTNSTTETVFEIIDVRLPIINIQTRDSGDKYEQFGSPLTLNPAWLR